MLTFAWIMLKLKCKIYVIFLTYKTEDDRLWSQSLKLNLPVRLEGKNFFAFDRYWNADFTGIFFQMCSPLCFFAAPIGIDRFWWRAQRSLSGFALLYMDGWHSVASGRNPAILFDLAGFGGSAFCWFLFFGSSQWLYSKCLHSNQSEALLYSQIYRYISFRWDSGYFSAFAEFFAFRYGASFYETGSLYDVFQYFTI